MLVKFSDKLSLEINNHLSNYSDYVKLYKLNNLDKLNRNQTSAFYYSKIILQSSANNYYRAVALILINLPYVARRFPEYITNNMFDELVMHLAHKLKINAIDTLSLYRYFEVLSVRKQNARQKRSQQRLDNYKHKKQLYLVYLKRKMPELTGVFFANPDLNARREVVYYTDYIDNNINKQMQQAISKFNLKAIKLPPVITGTLAKQILNTLRHNNYAWHQPYPKQIDLLKRICKRAMKLNALNKRLKFPIAEIVNSDLVKHVLNKQPDYSSMQLIEQHFTNQLLVQTIKNVLNEREQYIVIAWYANQLSLGAIGDHLGISSERVRQLRTRALQKLRRQLEFGEQCNFYDLI